MHWWVVLFIVSILLIVLFSIILNWLISLAILTQVTESKNIRIRSTILCSLSGIILGIIIKLL
jgi:hypothetical protein